MLRSNLPAIVGLAALVGGLSLAGSACFVSLDDSLIEDGTGSSDGGTDADATVSPEGGDAKPDVDAARPEAGTDADAGPDADEDAGEDAGEDADADTPDAPDDAADGDAMMNADADDGGEGGDPFDGPLVECYDETWCPPVDCTLRTCDQGSCVDTGVMGEDVTTFMLPSPLRCNQGARRKCAVAVRNYLVALTSDGFVVFNTRNPNDVRQETVPDNIGNGYNYLVRSGERVWAVKSSGGSSTRIAWLDVPLDGVSPLSPPSTTTVYVPALSSRLAAPNDAIFLYHTDSMPAGYVARYRPGLPTTLQSFATNGAVELEAMASTGSRLLMFELSQFTSNPTTYRYHFSLQSDILSMSSTNDGTFDALALVNTIATKGFFAVSRTGAVAWLVGRYDSTPAWRDLRVYWLVEDKNAPLDPASVKFEEYDTPPPGTPQGPIAFINDDTIAGAIITGGTAPTSQLAIVRRQPGTPPELVGRIPTSPLAPGEPNVAGDADYAYLITGQTVRMFAPECGS